MANDLPGLLRFGARGGRPLVLGHRGASQQERENTILAFSAARSSGADGVELDVRATSDGVLVVHHDPVLNVGGVDAPIASTAWSDIRAAAPWIPTLDQALDACRWGIVNVEIKNSPFEPGYDEHDDVAAQVARRLVDEPDARTRLIVSSFNPNTIGIVRRVAGDLGCPLPTGWLVLPRMDFGEAVRMASEAGHEAIHPHVSSLLSGRDDDVELARRMVDRAHTAGVVVAVWTGDEPNVITALARAGADVVITNVPDIARQALADDPIEVAGTEDRLLG